MKKIIYKNDDGQVVLVNPTPEALLTHTIHEIAVKDVPFGKPFAVVDESELPDYYTQSAWVVDENDLTDGVGGESNEFS